MASHHKMGMSRWTPWSICPHFDSMEDSSSATAGTEAHKKLKRLLDCDETVDIDESKQIDRAVLWAAYEIKNMCGDEELFTEERVEISKNISESLQGIYGSVDAFFVQHSGDDIVINIIDFKSLSHGDGDLWPQLYGYAIGVASKLECYSPDTKVCLHILHGGSFKHDRIMQTLGNCVYAGEAIVNSRKYKDGAKHCPSSWCKYCKYSSSCNATQQQIDIATSGALMSFSAPKRLMLIDALEGVLKKAKEEAKAEIALAPNRMMEDDGVAYGIVTKNGPSTLKDGVAVQLFNTCSGFGVTADDFMSICKLSKSDVMKVLASRAGIKIKSKKRNEITAEAIVSPYYTSNQVDKLERIK